MACTLCLISNMTMITITHLHECGCIYVKKNNYQRVSKVNMFIKAAKRTNKIHRITRGDQIWNNCRYNEKNIYSTLRVKGM